MIFQYGVLEVWYFVTWYEVVSSLFVLLGLYAYAFKKVVFTVTFWYFFFWYNVLATIVAILWEFTPVDTYINVPSWFSSQLEYTGTELLLGTFIGLPIFYALYKLGRSSNS